MGQHICKNHILVRFRGRYGSASKCRHAFKKMEMAIEKTCLQNIDLDLFSIVSVNRKLKHRNLEKNNVFKFVKAREQRVTCWATSKAVPRNIKSDPQTCLPCRWRR